MIIMKSLFVFILIVNVVVLDKIDDKVDLAMQYVQNSKKQIEKEQFLIKNNVIKREEYKNLQIVNDMKGWPEYVNNGDGP